MLKQLRLSFRRFQRLHRLAKALKTAVRRLKTQMIDAVRRLPGPANLGLPRGFYSELALLQTKPPRVEGRVVLLDQGELSAAPNSLLVLCGRNQHRMQPWPIFWARHREAELVGGSLALVDAQKRLCEEATYHALKGFSFGLMDPAYVYPRLCSKPLRLEGRWTSIVSAWMPVSRPRAYGHWIIDVLPRLALLKEFPADTQIIVPPFRPNYQVESMAMLGLLDRCRWTSEQHLRIEDYYFSAPTSMIACYNPYATQWTRDAFLPIVADDPRPTPRRFFVRRVGGMRNMVNETEVLDFFRDLGWDIVDAAELGFADQIRYFSQAEAVCAIHGSGFTNVLWCPPGVRLLELFADSYLASDAEWIARCIPSAVHGYLIFPSDHKLNAIVDLNRVKGKLRDLDLL